MRAELCIKITLILLAFTIFGCSPQPLTPPSPFARSVLIADSQKAMIVLYRSTKESFWFKSDLAEIYIDGEPFIYLAEGEYLPVYLAEGEHRIEASYSHSATLDFDKPAKAILKLKPGDVFYVLIIPEWEGIGFAPYYFLPLPVPGTAAKVYITSEEEARKRIGNLLEGDLLKRRFMKDN